MGDVVARFPWEAPAPRTTDDSVRALQKDVAYMVTHTAIMVHSPRVELQMLVNTARGQIVPRGECKFTDGTTVEFQDIGMPQPGAPLMTVKELAARVWDLARELGLELQQ